MHNNTSRPARRADCAIKATDATMVEPPGSVEPANSQTVSEKQTEMPEAPAFQGELSLTSP